MWKYKEVYMPSHPKSRQNGCVLEHRLVAEAIVGRILEDEEVVHHIDENRENNDINNLIVFISQDDHARFHKTGVMIENEDGTYYSPLIYDVCSHCGSTYEKGNRDKFCSKKCFDESRHKVKRPSKEELEILIKTTPFTTLGKMFNVSDNAIRKWCKAYGLPYKKKDLVTMRV